VDIDDPGGGAHEPENSAAAAKVVLRVLRLGVEFDGKVIFQDLNFELKDGETLSILGPNGSGKTVLLRALLGLVSCHGQVHWRAGTRIGYVPQRVPLARELPVTVADFFRMKRASLKDVAGLLAQVGITDNNFPQRRLGILSSGQFQRVLIAWALANGPDVLLFDEPTAGIDVGGEETIYTLLQRTQRERRLALILVTHDISIVYGYATNVLCLSNRTSCYGPPKLILDPNVLQSIYGSEVKFYQHAHD
jgi:zinc transport system ATP-binding protein